MNCGSGGDAVVGSVQPCLEFYLLRVSLLVNLMTHRPVKPRFMVFVNDSGVNIVSLVKPLLRNFQIRGGSRHSHGL